MARNDSQISLDKIDDRSAIFIEVDHDRVLRSARNPVQGRLSGIPIAVKDLIDTAELRTTYGSSIYADHIPKKNAAIVDKLEAEGAIILGKTNLDEFAYGVGAYNPHYGTVYNPADSTRTAGGSSGGSAAAVATGICRLSVGTDTSGSVRIPAACCNIYGFKLAHGAIAMDGIWPLAKTYDSIGYFSSSIEDLKMILNYEQLPNLKNLKIGHVGVDIEIPAFPSDAHFVNFRNQTWDVHNDLYNKKRDSYGRNIRFELDVIHSMESNLSECAVAARRELLAWRTRFLEAVAHVDVLVSSVFDGKAPTVKAVIDDYERDEFFHGDRLMRLTPIYNELGWPAMACPTRHGAIQIAARPGDEAAILAVGKQVGLSRNEILA